MSNKVPVYKFIAIALSRAINLEKGQNPARAKEILESITAWVRRHGPSGSGIDMGTRLDLDRSSSERIVLLTDFHHMDEHGGYDGWTHHVVVVSPSLLFGLDVAVRGRDRNDIKNYLGEIYQRWLSEEVENALVETLI